MIEADMGLNADLAFGFEEIRVGGVSKEVDVCTLADDLYDALQTADAAEDVASNPFRDMQHVRTLTNKVLAKYGFPEIAGTGAALKFAMQVQARAIALKKEARDVWPTDEPPASPPDSQDFDLPT